MRPCRSGRSRLPLADARAQPWPPSAPAACRQERDGAAEPRRAVCRARPLGRCPAGGDSARRRRGRQRALRLLSAGPSQAHDPWHAGSRSCPPVSARVLANRAAVAIGCDGGVIAQPTEPRAAQSRAPCPQTPLRPGPQTECSRTAARPVSDTVGKGHVAGPMPCRPQTRGIRAPAASDRATVCAQRQTRPPEGGKTARAAALFLLASNIPGESSRRDDGGSAPSPARPMRGARRSGRRTAAQEPRRPQRS